MLLRLQLIIVNAIAIFLCSTLWDVAFSLWHSCTPQLKLCTAPHAAWWTEQGKQNTLTMEMSVFDECVRLGARARTLKLIEYNRVELSQIKVCLLVLLLSVPVCPSLMTYCQHRCLFVFVI